MPLRVSRNVPNQLSFLLDFEDFETGRGSPTRDCDGPIDAILRV